ncbi:hypothetical protein HRS9122_00526 [Pyrenophora teres f. teres]|nr:hypothetical protein HRS9122_00526 [Pyrenophora teres f. teres]
MSLLATEDEPLLPKAPANVITFEPNDPEDPRNWSRTRKWLMVAAIVPIDLSVSWGASGFSPVAGDFSKDMDVSASVAVLGLSMYVLGLAFGPMTLAPLSEYFGRRPVYVVSYAIFLVLLLGTTYAESLGLFFVLRLFSGYFSSVTISNFGGTIADLFHHHDTGPAMSWFLWAATGGDEELEVPDEMKQRGPKQLFGTALLRPFRFLGTEAIVQFGAMYNGFLYGLSFLFNGAFHMIFGPDGYGFDTIGVGISFLGIVAGITIGLGTNIFQERYYQRQVIQAGNRDVPEARVHHAKLAAVVLPVSLLAFALTATPNIHPFFAVLASAFWGWSFYTLILMTLTYTEDAYKTYSASALAGIGLVRNLAGAGFPLVGRHLFLSVGTRNASLVLMAIAVCLAPIPFVLEKRGVSLRKRSPWAAAHEEEDESSQE